MPHWRPRWTCLESRPVHQSQPTQPTAATTSPDAATERPSDEEVIRRVLAGDLASFEHVMRRYNQRIYRLVRSIVRHDQEAEDVMQEAYISALSHLADFEGRARFSTWLMRIAMHEAFARTRGQRRREAFDVTEREEAVGLAGATPEQSASNSELRGILEGAIFALPDHFRTVFVLRDVQQLSIAETAEALDIPPDTVKTRLHRARALLREELSQRVDAALPSVLEFQGMRCDRIVAAVLQRLGVAR